MGIFLPNNDHPFLANPSELTNFIAAADNFLVNYPKVTARLLFSHYTESINDYSFHSPQYGYYADIFKRLIYKDNQIIVTASNKVSNDSIMLFRSGFLLDNFLAQEIPEGLLESKILSFISTLIRNPY